MHALHERTQVTPLMGTRLREETEYKPKPMVEIGGKMRETHESMGVPMYPLYSELKVESLKLKAG